MIEPEYRTLQDKSVIKIQPFLSSGNNASARKLVYLVSECHQNAAGEYYETCTQTRRQRVFETRDALNRYIETLENESRA